MSVIRKCEVVNEDQLFKKLYSRKLESKNGDSIYLLSPLLSGGALCFIALLWWHFVLKGENFNVKKRFIYFS